MAPMLSVREAHARVIAAFSALPAESGVDRRCRRPRAGERAQGPALTQPPADPVGDGRLRRACRGRAGCAHNAHLVGEAPASRRSATITR